MHLVADTEVDKVADMAAEKKNGFVLGWRVVAHGSRQGDRHGGYDKPQDQPHDLLHEKTYGQPLTNPMPWRMS